MRAKGLNSVVFPKTLLAVLPRAFYGNNLKSVALPEGLNLIQINAFQNNQIETLVLPSTLDTFGDEAFANNKLTYVRFNGPKPSMGNTNAFISNPTLLDKSVHVKSAYLSGFIGISGTLGLTSSQFVGY